MVQRLPNHSILLLRHPGSHLENALCHTFTSVKAQILPGESYSLGIIRLFHAVFRLPSQAVHDVERLTETKLPLCEFCCVGLYEADHRTD